MKQFTSIGTFLLTLLAFCFVSHDATADSPDFDQVAIVNVIDADFDQTVAIQEVAATVEDRMYSLSDACGNSAAQNQFNVPVATEPPESREDYPLFGNYGDKQMGFANALNAPNSTTLAFTNFKFRNVQRYWC